MQKYMLRSKLLVLLLLICIPVVFADLVISPGAMDLTVVRGQSTVFNVSVLNNASFMVYDVKFSNVTNFQFPQVFNLSAGEQRIISFSVLTNELFNTPFVSTVSYFYSINQTPPVKSVMVNITSTGFQSNNVSIFVNDSVLWTNVLSQDVEVKDLSSGFVNVPVPALSVVNYTYSSEASYAFYSTVGGFSGALSVVNRSSVVFAHDSTKDKQVVFTVHSVLPANSWYINVLSTNLSTQNNVSQTGIVEVKNTQNFQIIGINLSADRWIYNFSENNFNLDANQNKLIVFSVLPVVFRTNDTNKTQPVNITGRSLNTGNVSAVLNVFVQYLNMDTVVINGTTYVITVLGINETITACLQHMDDAGFEQCRKLDDFFGHNVTVIKEVPASYKFTEAQIANFVSALNVSGAVAERTENKMNLYLDKQDSVMTLVKNNSVEIKNWSLSTADFVSSWRDDLRALKTRDWTIFAVLLLIVLTWFTVWVVDNLQYIDALIRAKQL